MIRLPLLFVLFSLGLRADPTSAWTPLFNGQNLDGLYTFIASQGKNKDPQGIFTVKDGMIHVRAAEKADFGYFGTEKVYADYHLRFQFKWGAPQPGKKRNSGTLYHLTGEDNVWPRSVECQGQETDVGDLILIGGNISVATTVKSAQDGYKTFAKGGEPVTLTGNMGGSQTADTPEGWNTVEVVVRGNSSKHIVNGTLVAELTRIVSADTGAPIDSGRIVFQAEGAEIFYRHIEILPLAP